MKNLRFRNIWLLSRTEQTARHEDLSNPKTAILGTNKTGKSSLIKSIYQAFGADPERVHPKWKAANIEIRLDFYVDEIPFTIVRKSGHFGLFDANQRALIRTTHVTKGLGPFLAELLDFGMKTSVGRGTEMVTPPPAFCFLPYYADQDSSWENTWSGFAGLRAVGSPRKKCAEYHSGIRPNTYYEALAEQQHADRETDELAKELDILKRAKARFITKREYLSTDLKPEIFGDRIEKIISECETVKTEQDKIRRDLSDLVAERLLYMEQIRLSKLALSELDADYQFASSEPDEVMCPTCGTSHINDFVNRFSIMADADNCREIIAMGQEKLNTLNEKIENVQTHLNDIGKEAIRLNSLLSEERGKLRLRDLLQGESERMLDKSFSDEFELIESKIGDSMRASADADKRKRQTTDRKRSKAIADTFQIFMTKFLLDLDVHTLPEKEYKDIRGNINTTGSERPRALLAYKYAFFHTMLAHSTSPLCPMVIDSPLQQDQDDENIPRILNFIVSNTPNSCQLVLGSVKLHGIDFDGHIINTTVKHKLLEEEMFDAAKQEMDPFVNSLLD